MEIILLIALAVVVASMFARFQVSHSKYKSVSGLPEIAFIPKRKVGNYVWFNDTEFAIPLLIRGETRIVKKQLLTEVLRYEILLQGEKIASGDFNGHLPEKDLLTQPHFGKRLRKQISSMGLKLCFSTDNPPEVTLEFLKKAENIKSPTYQNACTDLIKVIDIFSELKQARPTD